MAEATMSVSRQVAASTSFPGNRDSVRLTASHFAWLTGFPFHQAAADHDGCRELITLTAPDRRGHDVHTWPPMPARQ